MQDMPIHAFPLQLLSTGVRNPLQMQQLLQSLHSYDGMGWKQAFVMPQFRDFPT